ncbi:KxYKxGKxW signal peptide domain-containing protein, partial [Levilactobacillus parabrevis]
MAVKEHYKMYKDGKHWVFAAITVAAIGLGTAVGQDVLAHADSITAGAETTQASGDSADPSSTVTLPKATTDTTVSGEQGNAG